MQPPWTISDIFVGTHVLSVIRPSTKHFINEPIQRTPTSNVSEVLPGQQRFNLDDGSIFVDFEATSLVDDDVAAAELVVDVDVLFLKRLRRLGDNNRNGFELLNIQDF